VTHPLEEADMHPLRNFFLRGRLTSMIMTGYSVAVLVACPVFAVYVDRLYPELSGLQRTVRP
jgi:hypothetical protein